MMLRILAVRRHEDVRINESHRESISSSRAAVNFKSTPGCTPSPRKVLSGRRDFRPPLSRAASVVTLNDSSTSSPSDELRSTETSLALRKKHIVDRQSRSHASRHMAFAS